MVTAKRTRHEFPTRIKVVVIKRATRSGLIYCEKCHALAKRFQIDHVIADAIGGKPVIENAELLCEPCFQVKNPEDTRKAAKTKRIEAKHIGAERQKTPIASRPKNEKPAPRFDKTSLPPRQMYENAK